MELTKQTAINGDNFAKRLLSNSPMQQKEVYDFFRDKNEAIFICKILREKSHVKFLSPSDTEPFRVIEKKESLSDFMDSGGFVKIVNDLEKQSTEKKLIDSLNKRLNELSIINLELQNKQLKTKIIYSIIGAIFSALVTNWKYILSMLQSIDKQ